MLYLQSLAQHLAHSKCSLNTVELMNMNKEEEQRQDGRKFLLSRKFTALGVISCIHKAFKPREKVLGMLVQTQLGGVRGCDVSPN